VTGSDEVIDPEMVAAEGALCEQWLDGTLDPQKV